MKGAFADRENVVADGGYKDSRTEKIGDGGKVPDNFRALARAIYETVNRRFKQFGPVGQGFRHDVSLYSMYFHAVANLTQLSIEQGESLFGVLCN